MKKNTLATILMIICLTAFISGCKKDVVNPTAVNWAGVYNAPAGSQVTQVVISGNNNALRVELKQIEYSYQYTSVILTSVMPDPATGVAKINETASIIENTGTYKFTGTVSVNNGHVTLNSVANSTDSTETNTKTFYFSGDKVQ